MEVTPHEGKMNRLHGEVAYCQVLSIDTNDRTVAVRAFAPSTSPLNSMSPTRVKLLGMSNHISGAESVHLPDVGSIGILMYVESQPYIIGFFNPDDPNQIKTDANGFNTNRTPINRGDTILYGKRKNFVAVRNSGVVEIESSSQLKTFYLPERGEISTFCLNYDFQTNGGSTTWVTTDKERTTKLTTIIKDQVGATQVARIEGGNVDGDNILTLKTGVPNDNQGIDNTNFSLEIKDTGETTIAITDKATLNIKETGATTFDSKLNLGITLEDALVITAKKDVTVHSETNMNLTAMQKLFAEADNIIANAKTAGKLGTAASEPIVLGNVLLTLLKTFVQSYNQHMHPYVDTPVGPSVTQPTMLPATPFDSSMLSKKWKVE
jgi:hypothetical protein